MKKALLLLLFLLTNSVIVCFADDNYAYWVQFSDKNNTPYSLENPAEYLSEKALARRQKQQISTDSTDLPVNQTYIDAILATGAKLHTQSRWLNGITVFMDNETVVEQIKTLPFVVGTEKTFVAAVPRKAKTGKEFPPKRTAAANNGYGNAFRQINMLQGDWLHAQGFRGNGITIALLDAGFLNVDDNSAYSQLWNNGQIVGTKDFVNPQSDIFNENYHGSVVFSTLAAQKPDQFIGTAPDADYWLIRTENHATEFPIEMDNMVAGMEFADSVGVDIINSSLGYYNFDDAAMNLQYSDLDGKKLRISRAATLCARKGMIFVCSAGNQGNKAWQHITAPADADSILTVGAVDEQLVRSAFSGIGATADGRTKPDVCALGSRVAVVNQNDAVSASDGTSFSAPVIAGMVACLWQALPDLTNMQLLDAVKKSASNYPNPNNETGFGVPDFYAAYSAEKPTDTNMPINPPKIKAYPNPVGDSLTIETEPSLLAKKMIFALTDLNGKMLLNGNIEKSTEIISLDNLPRGVYILQVKAKKKVVFQGKIVRE